MGRYNATRSLRRWRVMINESLHRYLVKVNAIKIALDPNSRSYPHPRNSARKKVKNVYIYRSNSTNHRIDNSLKLYRRNKEGGNDFNNTSVSSRSRSTVFATRCFAVARALPHWKHKSKTRFAAIVYIFCNPPGSLHRPIANGALILANHRPREELNSEEKKKKITKVEVARLRSPLARRIFFAFHLERRS